MTGYPEKRGAPRTALPGHPTAWTRDGQAVRLIDLSLTGARIGHLDVLPVGLESSLELPAALGFLLLSTQVVWSAAIQEERYPRGGDRRLRAWSGLKFVEMTEYQQTVLERALSELGAETSPA